MKDFFGKIEKNKLKCLDSPVGFVKDYEEGGNVAHIYYDIIDKLGIVCETCSLLVLGAMCQHLLNFYIFPIDHRDGKCGK